MDYVKKKTREKTKKKLAYKRGVDKEYARDEPKSTPIEKALKELSNDTFYTDNFWNNHMARTAPDSEYADKVARQRNGEQSTVLFLEGDDLQVLTDDIREHHAQMFRKPSGVWVLLTSSKAYPYIDVVQNPVGTFTVSATKWGRIRFGLQKVGSVDLGVKTSPVYAISHMEEMYESGQDQEKEEGKDKSGDSEDERSVDDSDEV